MNEYVDTCSWKMVDPSKFVMGQEAERCGEVATIRVIRPNRKTDLFLCECHLNNFIDAWGLHYNVEVICPKPVEDIIKRTIRPHKGHPCGCPEACLVPGPDCLRPRGWNQ